MDTATETLIFQKLDELIHDQDKIVTSLSVATDLKLSIQDTKYILKKYVDDMKPLHPDLRATYLVSGRKNGEMMIVMVTDEELKEFRASLDDVSSEVVCSLQKGGNIDCHAICLANYGHHRNTALPGSVVGKNCIEIKLKTKELPPVPPNKTVVKKGSIKAFIPEEKTNKSQEIRLEKPSNKTQPITNSKGKANSGIKNFFNTDTGNVKENKVNGKSNDEKKENYEELKATDMKTETEEKMEVDEVEKKPKKENKEKKSKRPRKNETNNEERASKKRKRIQDICDSDDSDIFEDIKEEEDIIETSDTETPPKPQITAKPLEPKNKRRKAVERTYKDDDGYLVTKIEYIYESASDDEEKPIIKEENQKENKTKTIVKKNSSTDSENDTGKKGKGRKNNKKPPAKGIQPTLMSFFSKK